MTVRKIIIAITITICIALISGCYYEYTAPTTEDWVESGALVQSGTLTVAIETENGGALAYQGEELLIWVDSEESTKPVSIEIISSDNLRTIIVEDYYDSFPFLWNIPVNFEPGESYRIIVSDADEFYKNTIAYGISDEFAILSDNSSGLSDITVSSQNINITLTDNGSVIDGDTVSISLNNIILDSNHVLAGYPGTDISLNLPSGINTLSITAVNEGSVSPNTAEITFTDVIAGEELQQWRLNEGETGTVLIYLQ